MPLQRQAVIALQAPARKRLLEPRQLRAQLVCHDGVDEQLALAAALPSSASTGRRICRQLHHRREDRGLVALLAIDEAIVADAGHLHAHRLDRHGGSRCST
jgi:hypothetical protein